MTNRYMSLLKEDGCTQTLSLLSFSISSAHFPFKLFKKLRYFHEKSKLLGLFIETQLCM
jgi:hypothetical protein